MELNQLFESNDECDEEFFKKRFERLCDSDCQFIVSCDRVVIKGHKLIFSLASKMFYALFYENSEEDSAVSVSDLEPEGFEKMKKYIYTGEVIFNNYDEVYLTMEASRECFIPQLFKICVEILKDAIDIDTIPVLYYCYVKEMEELDITITGMNEVIHNVIEERTHELLDDVNFILAKPEIISWVLSFESMALNSELDLYKFIEKWGLAKIEHNNDASEELGLWFNNFVGQIRFMTMDAKEFAEVVKSTLSLLTVAEKLAIALNMAEFGSTPYPHNLSANRKKRNFTRR